MEKLSSAALLGLLDNAVLELVPKEIAFTIDGKDYTVNIAVKRLSFDESVDLTRGQDLTSMLMADLHKIRILKTVYNADTKEPLFVDIVAAGRPVSAIVDAMYKASEEVNDFSGKQQIKHLKKMSSGASLSVAESVEAPSEKQNEI